VSANDVGTGEYGTSSSTGQFLWSGRSPAMPTIQRAPSARANHDQRLSAGRIARSKRGSAASARIVATSRGSSTCAVTPYGRPA